MSMADAWLLNLGEGLFAAVGELELVHLLPADARLFEIPKTPAHCCSVLVWQAEILPLMNLALRVLGRPITESLSLIAIAGFQDEAGAETQFGALALYAPPIRIQVNDSQACGLPDSQADWSGLPIACFEHVEHGPVPILNLGEVFAPAASRFELLHR